MGKVDHEVIEIRKVKLSKKYERERVYLVKWCPAWVQEKHLAKCQRFVNSFWKSTDAGSYDSRKEEFPKWNYVSNGNNML
jgi:hypothetical protein